MPDDDWIPREPNDNAFVVREVREGVPLDYVSEKLQTGIEQSALAIKEIKEYMPDDISFPSPPYPPNWDSVKVSTINTLVYSFRSQVIAYVALSNMLAVANDRQLFERLLGYTSEELKRWLERIWSSGQTSEKKTYPGDTE